MNVHTGTPPTGSISYRDTSTDFRTLTITSATCPDPTHATIRGAGRNNGDDVGYRVDVVDGGESSVNDFFTLTMNPGGARAGTLSKGNIQIHRR